MFVVYCPTHGSDVMLGIRRVRGGANVRGLIVLELECHDGTRILHVTGRKVDAARAA
ncbi:MAG: hypothetical protein QOD68_473 [Actinomycetota bacterium]|jgi:Rieske Fe-S protein|nr:hypothetical protein [Actinomycetota bacterium]